MSSIFSWDTLWYVLIVLYVPACLGLIFIVLMQKGKGTGFGGAFGSGGGPGAETVFGPRAGQTLPVKLTYVAAGIFVVMSMSMSLIAGRVGRGRAPELVDGATGSAPASVQTGLEDLGLGGSKQGAGAASGAPAAAPATEVPATPAGAVAPTADAPAAPVADSSAVPAEQKPAETAPNQ